MSKKSFLSIVNKVDTFPYTEDNRYYRLVAHDGVTTLGYLTSTIAVYFSEDSSILVDHEKKTVNISSNFDSLDKRNSLFAEIAARWRTIPELYETLEKGWRNELYTIYNPSHEPYLQIERAFSVLIGVITYGTHINGYVPAEKSSNGKLKLWIPRRSPTKPTYPGMLDNTVAGGIGYPYGIWETVIKECFEEAGLSPEFVESHIKSAGVLSYMYQPESDGGNVQPEVEFIYDLEFDNEVHVIPSPEDGEAEDFRLIDVDEVIERLYNNEFKPNSGLVIVDFLIRHGYITPESEQNFMEIVSRSHRKLLFPTM